MALDTELRSNIYFGNASTEAPYAILFPYLRAADIRVQVKPLGQAEPTLLTESEYTVIEPGPSGSPYVITTVAYPVTTVVEVFRWLPYLQPVVMPEGGKLSSEVIERALDRITMLAMQSYPLGGYSIPSGGVGGALKWLNEAARATTAPAYIGQLGLQTLDRTLWSGLSTYAGDWEEVNEVIQTTGRYVRTEGQFQAALAEAGALTIYLRKNITLQVLHTQGINTTIVTGNFMFVQGSDSGGLICMGPVIAARQQIFSGFAAGEIRGTFGSGLAYPELGGLIDGFHDMAIHCAIKASPWLTGLTESGICVSLGARHYDVSAPIVLTGSRSVLRGNNTRSTFLKATANWAPTAWWTADVGNWDVVTGGNHSAMVIIGGSVASPSTYHTGVECLSIDASLATAAHPTRYVSGITAEAWVEECSIIDRVDISGYSGAGIGFPGHNGIANVINGLSCTNFWLTGSNKSESVGILTTHWCYNCEFSMGTGDFRVTQASSVAGIEFPHYGILAGGKTRFNQIHIEGVGIGILVPRRNATNNVAIDGLSVNHLMTRANAATYYTDGLSAKAPGVAGYPADGNTNWYGYSAAVLIGGVSEADPGNTADNVSIGTIMSIGQSDYLIRDQTYDQHYRTYGRGQYPLTPSSGCSGYRRGSAYTWTTVTTPFDTPGPVSSTNFTAPRF